MTAVPHPPYFFVFPRLKVKLKGRHFDRIEVIEAESHALLNTITENDIQDNKTNSVALVRKVTILTRSVGRSVSRLPGCIQRTAEMPGAVHMRRRGLLRG
jgi:hypothetical protein